MGINTEPDMIGGRLLKKGLCGRLAEAAIGTGNQNDAQAHAGIVAVGAPVGKCELLEPPNRKNIQRSTPNYALP
jgi:hypothetical protein